MTDRLRSNPGIIDLIHKDLRETGKRIDRLVNNDRSIQDWYDLTFNAPWGNIGGQVGGAFWRSPSGLVMLRGVVTGGVINTSMTTLPDGFRPAFTVRFV